MLDWITCVTTFQQIVETGSFSQTAKKQYTSPSAITKRINWLEEALNAPLFIRSTRKISITEAGQTLYERSLSLINEWDDIKQAVNIQHKEVTGTLRIGVPTGFGSQHLVSMLPKFLDQYPSVAVNLKLSNCVSQLADEEIDVYITRELSGKNNQKFHQQPVMEIHHKIYASPSYLKKQGNPKTLKDLEHHNCIKICYQNTYNWEFDAETLLIDGSLTTNNTIAGINAAIAGIGLVCLCPMSIKKEIKQGLLVPVLPEYQSRRKKIYAFYPKQNFIPKKTLAFIDHLKAHFLKDNPETDQKT
jgi:DNA-binding transcriptional LysR family regulator